MHLPLPVSQCHGGSDLGLQCRWVARREFQADDTLRLQRVFCAPARPAEAYRCLLHAEGREVKDAQNEKVVRRGVTVVSARTVLAAGGKLSPAELVRLRVRYFTDGVVLGSKEFVEGVFAEQRDRFGPKRKDGGRRIAESDAPFYTLRQWRVRPVG